MDSMLNVCISPLITMSWLIGLLGRTVTHLQTTRNNVNKCFRVLLTNDTILIHSDLVIDYSETVTRKLGKTSVENNANRVTDNHQFSGKIYFREEHD